MNNSSLLQYNFGNNIFKVGREGYEKETCNDHMFRLVRYPHFRGKAVIVGRDLSLVCPL